MSQVNAITVIKKLKNGFTILYTTQELHGVKVSSTTLINNRGATIGFNHTTTFGSQRLTRKFRQGQACNQAKAA